MKKNKHKRSSFLHALLCGSRNFSDPWKPTVGRLIGIIFIRHYQIFFSPFVGRHCRHLPTCSEYAYEAIARYGLFCGIGMAFIRVLRCGPFGGAGFNPVPKRKQKKRPFFSFYKFFFTRIFYFSSFFRQKQHNRKKIKSKGIKDLFT